MNSHLDWSAYEGGSDFGFGFGDAFGAPVEPGSGFGKAAAACNGKLQCLSDEHEVMCPSYRATQDPRHSTHHRALTLQAAAEGRLGEHAYASAEMIEALALCVGCKGCKRECPNGVDMALMVAEAHARRWQAVGKVPLRERMFARMPELAPHLARVRSLLRLRDKIPGAARLLERVLGIAAARSLPRPAEQAFLDRAPVEHDGTAGEVVLLVDTFSNHFDPELAEAAQAVLVAAGYRVHLARPQDGGRALCCGRSYLSSGFVEQARAEASRMVAALMPHVERGLPVIGLEPSCLLMLRDEYHALGLGSAVAALARSALLLEEFLAREHDAGRLTLRFPDQAGRRVLVHGHCHQKAFGLMPAMHKVLGLIPGLEVRTVDSSCCGMGGSFGYKAEHFEVSMAMAEASLLPAVRGAAPDTAIVANGTSCRHQILDGAGRPAQHLAHVLHAALGHGRT